jgi:hypothetical protein
MYSPPDLALLEASHYTLWSYSYQGDSALRVIQGAGTNIFHESSPPGYPVGSGCAAMPISVPQPAIDLHCFAYCLSSWDWAPPLSTRISQYNYQCLLQLILWYHLSLSLLKIELLGLSQWLWVPNLLGDWFFSPTLSAIFEEVWCNIVKLWEHSLLTVRLLFCSEHK